MVIVVSRSKAKTVGVNLFKSKLPTVLATTLLLASMNVSAATASFYGKGFHGRTTASGEVFNRWAMTAASNSHKMGTKLKVTNKANGKSIVVKVNDRGNFTKYGRVLDLSRGAFSKIANINQGIAKVSIKVIK